METSRQDKCIVSGLLGVVLHVSRIVGIAPLSFKQVRSGWSIVVSRTAYNYGLFLGCALYLLTILSLILEMILETESSFRMPTTSTKIVKFTEVVVVGSVAYTAAQTGLNRMKCFVEFLPQLHKINSLLNVHRRIPPNERTRIAISISLVTLLLLTQGSDLASIIEVFNNNLVDSISLFNIVCFMCCTTVLEILVIQFNNIATYVLFSVQTLNNSMKNLLEDITDNSKRDSSKHLNIKTRMQSNIYRHICNEKFIRKNSSNTLEITNDTVKPARQSLQATVRTYAYLYCYLCDVVRQMSDNHGAVLMTLLLSLLIHLIITPFHIIKFLVDVSWVDDDYVPILLLFSWTVIHTSNLLLIVEPCHQTCDQMNLTKELILNMLRFTSAKDDELYSELKMFYRHLTLNQVSYAPWQMFVLDRSILVALLGSIITYLAIIVEY